MHRWRPPAASLASPVLHAASAAPGHRAGWTAFQQLLDFGLCTYLSEAAGGGGGPDCCQGGACVAGPAAGTAAPVPCRAGVHEPVHPMPVVSFPSLPGYGSTARAGCRAVVSGALVETGVSCLPECGGVLLPAPGDAAPCPAGSHVSQSRLPCPQGPGAGPGCDAGCVPGRQRCGGAWPLLGRTPGDPHAGLPGLLAVPAGPPL